MDSVLREARAVVRCGAGILILILMSACAPAANTQQPGVAIEERGSQGSASVPAGNGSVGAAEATVTTTSGATGSNQIPALTLQTLGPSGQGNSFELRSLSGRPLLLDLWASWCEPCRQELPLLDAIAKRHAGALEVVAVSVDEERGAAEDFMTLVPSWTLRLAHDPEGRIGRALNPKQMPTTYLFDASGRLVFTNDGFHPGDEQRLQQEVNKVLGAH